MLSRIASFLRLKKKGTKEVSVLCCDYWCFYCYYYYYLYCYLLLLLLYSLLLSYVYVWGLFYIWTRIKYTCFWCLLIQFFHTTFFFTVLLIPHFKYYFCHPQRTTKWFDFHNLSYYFIFSFRSLTQFINIFFFIISFHYILMLCVYHHKHYHSFRTIKWFYILLFLFIIPSFLSNILNTLYSHHFFTFIYYLFPQWTGQQSDFALVYFCVYISFFISITNTSY